MCRSSVIAIITLSVVMVISMGLNVLASRLARKFYAELSGSRLDPLGLKSYPRATEPLPSPSLLFYGDSRAKEWPAPDGLKNTSFINRGIGNQTTAQVLGRFQAHVSLLKPDVIVVQAGVNDLKAIPLFPSHKKELIDDCKANISRIVNDSVESGARVVVTTIFPLGKVPIERWPVWSGDVAAAIREVNAHIKTLADEKVTVFDTGRILTNEQGIVFPKLSRDLLHLTPEGYAALNRELVKILV
ncbi:MAG: lysophospholipase, partial [Chthoniobacteraceae bacterium]|nr:lysophospholipase [Chthoniobacteraceae bacterium]